MQKDGRTGAEGQRLKSPGAKKAGCTPRHTARPANARSRPLLQLLQQTPYFAGLDDAALAGIARAVRPRVAQLGEHILAEGEPCLGLYFVLRGQVRLVKRAADGREHVLRVLGPGATFNEAAVFDGGPNSETAVAI